MYLMIYHGIQKNLKVSLHIRERTVWVKHNIHVKQLTNTGSDGVEQIKMEMWKRSVN